eukprot:1422724-Amphidinium_carterae.1
MTNSPSSKSAPQCLRSHENEAAPILHRASAANSGQFGSNVRQYPCFGYVVVVCSCCGWPSIANCTKLAISR